MGNALGKVCAANESEIPVVVVVSQAGPLYWKALQPGQSWTQKTGKVWFTLEAYPYTGNYEPTKLGAAVSVLVPTGAALAAVLTGGLEAGFASAAKFGGKALHSALTRSCNHAMKKGYYADGHQVRVQGGPKKRKPCKEWKPLRFV